MLWISQLGPLYRSDYSSDCEDVDSSTSMKVITLGKMFERRNRALRDPVNLIADLLSQFHSIKRIAQSEIRRKGLGRLSMLL